MLVVCAFENAASGQLLATQSAVRQHTLNSQFHGEVALLGHQGAILDFLQVADVAGVVLIQLLVQLVAGENGLIGVDDDDSFPQIMEVYNSYPLEELIVHPRVRTDYYRNELHLDAFRYAVDNSRNKLVLNGDIFTRKNFLEMKEIFPKVDTFMLGRGLIADPGLINVLTDDNPEAMVRDLNADKKLMKELHDLVYAARTAIMPGDTHAIHRMKEMWCYMEYVFDDSKNEIKAIKKSQRMADYNAAVDVFFNKAMLVERKNIIFSKKF